MSLRLAVFAAIAALSIGVAESGDAADAGEQLEERLRGAFMIPADMKLSFAAENGAAISREEFARQFLPGKGMQIVLEKDEAAHKGVLRLDSPKPEAPAPTHLPAVDLTDLTGRRVRSQDLTGKPTLVNFFFEACVPCIKEAPMLSAFARQHPEFHYLAVTFESREAAGRFADQRKLDWPVFAEARAFIDAAGVKGYPTYMLVAADGRILGRGSGMELRAMNDPPKALAEFETWVRKSLGAPAN